MLAVYFVTYFQQMFCNLGSFLQAAAQLNQAQNHTRSLSYVGNLPCVILMYFAFAAFTAFKDEHVAKSLKQNKHWWCMVIAFLVKDRLCIVSTFNEIH